MTEQAKGVLMAAYGSTANHAFKILAWRSQETNIKVALRNSECIDELLECSAV